MTQTISMPGDGNPYVPGSLGCSPVRELDSRGASSRPDEPTGSRDALLGLANCRRSSPGIWHHDRVFIERVTAPRDEFELRDARLRMVTEPPPALVASFAWESGGEVTCINVWDSPQAIADFFLERVQPFVDAEGPPANKPQRLGPAIRAYVRP